MTPVPDELTSPVPEALLLVKEPEPVVLVVREPETILIDTAPGPQGRPGPVGSVGASAYELAVQNGFVGNVTEWLESLRGEDGGNPYHRHVQSAVAATWVIDHTLPYQPAVTVLDSAERVWEGDVQYLSATTVVVSFAFPFTGEAWLS